MKIIQCDKKENSKVEVLVEVSREEYDLAAGKIFMKVRKSMPVPGFRNGKAPRRVVERIYGATVFLSDALELLYPDILKTISDEDDYKIVDQPVIADVDFKEEGGGLSVTVAFTAYPEVELGEYKGISATKVSSEVPESEIDAEIAEIRLRNARFEGVDRPAEDGDTAVIDFEGFLDGEPFDGGKGDGFELELGSGLFIPGFEEKVVGMTAGETRDIDLVFPDEYEPGLAGKAVVFKVSLIEVREKQMPDLDDEFAKDVSEFDTLSEYKADIRAKLEEERRKEADEAFEGALMDKIIDNMDADVPEMMIEKRMDAAMKSFAQRVAALDMDPMQYLQMMGTTPEAFRESSRSSSIRQARIALALDKIAELEGIEISDEEIEGEYAAAAERLGKEAGELRDNVDRDDLAHDLKLRAALKLVMDNAVAVDAADNEDGEGAAVKKPAAKKTAQKKPAAKQSADKEPAGEKPDDGMIDKGDE